MPNEIIARAAASESFTNNPVPAEILEEFSGNLLDFASIPYLAKNNLIGLYPAGTDIMSAVSQDWADSFEAGAIKLYGQDTVSFALSVELMNGTPLEASIRRNARDGKPWYMSYAPDPLRLSIRREETSTSTAPAAEAPKTSEFADSIPAPLKDAVLAMGHNAEYTSGAVPSDIAALLASYEGSFSDFVWISGRWRETLRELSGLDMNVEEFLNREWAFAQQNGCTRFYEDKVIFPVSVLRDDHTTPVEVSIRQNKRTNDQPEEGMCPWVVTYVEDYVRTRPNPKTALREWAWLGNINEMLESLAAMALPEPWDFVESADEKPRYAILRNYLNYTFRRLQADEKVLMDKTAGIAAFNTGLVDSTYEDIYACFSHCDTGLEWRFEAFCKAGSRGWGKKLVSTFNPLPARASYISRKEDLIFDTDSPLTPDVDHILLDNIDRLPHEFLEEELVGNEEAMKLVEQAFGEGSAEDHEVAFDKLSDLVESDIRIRRRLKNRLDDAIELACKRAEWNFRTAVPAWYPTRDVMCLLLPLDLTEDDRPDIALVVELAASGAYLGQTILTMSMAYTNARLICRPDSDWLNTSLKLFGIDHDEDVDERD